MIAELEMGVLSDVIYLLDLHKLTKEAVYSPVRKVTEVLLSDLRDVSCHFLNTLSTVL